MRTLTHFQLCPYSRAIRLAMAELNLDVKHIDQRPWEIDQEFLKLNPSGELPVLQVGEGDTVCGWYAICEYLSETDWGKDSDVAEASINGDEALHAHASDVLTRLQPTTALFPGDNKQRAEVRRLVDWFHGRLHREVVGELLHEKVYGRMSFGADHVPQVEIMRSARGHLRYHLGYIGTLARDRRWLAGEEYSFADIAAAGQLSALDYLGEIPWNEFRFAKEWFQRVKSRRAFRSLLGDRVPGVPPSAHYDNLDF